MKTVYLMVSHSGTAPANLVRFFTHKDYSHACYARDESLSNLYTFGRIHTAFFIPGGFITGGIDSDFYKHYPHTKICVYAATLTQAQYETVEARLAVFLKNPQQYHYGFANCVFQFFGMRVHRRHHYTCSQFIAQLFADILPLQKDWSLAKPTDFCNLALPCVFEGTAEEYTNMTKQKEAVV
ncbi:MAG: hypothetical protein RSF70_03710 [Ruthenibacterium sp.]